MNTITEKTIINASPSKVWEFLTNLHKDDNYKKWHPQDHISFTLLKGNSATPGSVMYIQERLGNFILRLPYRLRQSTFPNYLEYTLVFPLSLLRLGKGYFRMDYVKPGVTNLTAYVEYGYSMPIISETVDWFISLFIDKFAAEKHIHEEGENIKRLLENR